MVQFQFNSIATVNTRFWSVDSRKVNFFQIISIADSFLFCLKLKREMESENSEFNAGKEQESEF